MTISPGAAEFDYPRTADCSPDQAARAVRALRLMAGKKTRTGWLENLPDTNAVRTLDKKSFAARRAGLWTFEQVDYVRAGTYVHHALKVINAGLPDLYTDIEIGIDPTNHDARLASVQEMSPKEFRGFIVSAGQTLEANLTAEHGGVPNLLGALGKVAWEHRLNITDPNKYLVIGGAAAALWLDVGEPQIPNLRLAV